MPPASNPPWRLLKSLATPSAVSSLGGLRTPAPVCAAPPAWGRHPQTFTVADFPHRLALGPLQPQERTLSVRSLGRYFSTPHGFFRMRWYPATFGDDVPGSQFGRACHEIKLCRLVSRR